MSIGKGIVRLRFGKGAVIAVLVLGACSSAGRPETTVPADPAQSPDAVAAVVLDALAAGDAEAAAANTIQEQMVWLAMAEGASLQEAASMLEDETESIALNYWTGFSQSAAVPPLAISSIVESRVGEHNFAIVSLGNTDDLRLVLRSEPEWRVDVVASFGSTLVARLADVVEVVAANSGDEADRLRQVLGDQKDSVDVASSDSALEDTARQALIELAEALQNLSS